ncbi:histidine phosphatase family protein [Geothrix sp. PMB-07]|uniref:histidine phosphatase family protein n=1 Tax=Geothrix sp. PMB-07 TaxID=3068640 RepID=UPI0027421345|nr:histidine phosphatase family protein [Geothrix sp. PMB-07]WLT30304.1 histidine phosphatase family protein [Geothrix sp. PMB-07]
MTLRFCRFLFVAFMAMALNLWAQDTTVILLRHAERQSLLDGDSPLSEAGLRRAQALVPQLQAFKPQELHCSDLQRTQQTLAPLAASLKLTPNVHGKGASEELAAEILRGPRGRTVIICWHHDLMKKLVRGLGVKGPIPYWSLDTYDRLWLVRIPAKGEPTLEERPQNLAPAAPGPTQR